MNWYKKSQTGEWWIVDGSAQFADGDVGDMNHETYVIQSVQNKYVYDEFSRGDYIDWDGFKTKLAEEAKEEYLNEFGVETTEDDETLYLKKLNEMGMSTEEYKIAEGMGDARKYGMEKLGWKRVQKNNIETQTLTADDLSDIKRGLYDIEDNLLEETTFNIYVVSTGAYYTDVPFKAIEEGNLVSIIGLEDRNTTNITAKDFNSIYKNY
jgi:hypothetical protein